MVDRPQWNFGPDGNPVEPAPTSHQELVTAIKNDPGPAQMPASVPADQSAPVPSKRGVDGIMRQDWNNQAPVPARKSFSGLPDWDKPRNESGQFITKSEGELRQTWQREGGLDRVAQAVRTAEAQMVALAPSLQGQIAKLPNDIQLIAADHLRLAPSGFGREDNRFSQFLDTLSESQFETFRSWFANLSADEQNAILDTVM